MYYFDSRIRYSEADPNGQAALHTILDYFQDCSSFHSEDLGIGIEYLKQKECAWILVSWQVVVERFPSYGERVRVSTWPYDFKSFYGCRNFLMTDEAGSHLAYADSLWALMDLKAHRPMKVLPEMQSAYQMEPPLPVEKESRKIKVPDDLKPKAAFQVHRYHLDTNQHVNNGKYILMAQEYLPDTFRIGRLRTEYKKSAVYGDTIYPFVAAEEDKTVVVLGDGQRSPYAVIEFKEA